MILLRSVLALVAIASAVNLVADAQGNAASSSAEKVAAASSSAEKTTASASASSGLTVSKYGSAALSAANPILTVKVDGKGTSAVTVKGVSLTRKGEKSPVLENVLFKAVTGDR